MPDTVGGVTGRASGPLKSCANYSQRFSSRSNAERKLRGIG